MIFVGLSRLAWDATPSGLGSPVHVQFAWRIRPGAASDVMYHTMSLMKNALLRSAKLSHKRIPKAVAVALNRISVIRTLESGLKGSELGR
jgi:hypothetical protein